MWGSKQSNLKKLSLLAVALLLFIPSFLPSSIAVTIDNSLVDKDDHTISEQRSVIHYGSAWYFIYWNGTNYIEKNSTNLSTFSAKKAIFVSINSKEVTGNINAIDVKLVGTKVLACVVNGSRLPASTINQIWFINGTVSSSGITWASPKSVANKTVAFFGHFDTNTCTVSSYDGSTIWIAVNDIQNSYIAETYKSTNSGSTWATSLADINQQDGGFIIALSGSKAMFIAANPVECCISDERILSSYYTGGAWSAYSSPSDGYIIDWCCTSDLAGRPLSAVADPVSPDRVHLVYTNKTGYIKYIIYNSGWGTNEIVATPTYTSIASSDTTSYPVLSVDTSNNSTVVAWAKNDVVYYRTRSSAGAWGSITVVANESVHHMPRERDLRASITNMGGKILYTYLTGSGAPFNLTLAEIDQAVTTTTTTSTTMTVTTLTTQTTTADTILDATTNQFAAVMTNFFPAFMIITVFVYLAYKAGASGEVLAYVFIITLVLTSFVNLMPWWITLVTTVLMVAIIFQYRQSGGAVK